MYCVAKGVIAVDKFIKGTVLKVTLFFCVCICAYLVMDSEVSKDQLATYAESSVEEGIQSKADFAVAFKQAYFSGEVIDEISNTRNGSFVSTGSGKSTGIVINNRFELYDGPTVASNRARVVDVRKVLEADNRSLRKWAMGEGFPTAKSAFANKYAFTDEGGGIVKEECNPVTQMYRGRHLAAFGPGVVMENYVGQYVTLQDMKYGTYVDVVVLDDDGTEYWIPCVVADAKVHTYSNGIYQTGIRRNQDGSFDDQSLKHADDSVVEFCTQTSFIKGLSKYRIDRLVVYGIGGE